MAAIFRSSRHILIFGGFNRIRTMMQIFASVAKLRSSDAHSLVRHSSHGVGRANATSDRSWQFVAKSVGRPKLGGFFLSCFR